MTCRCGANGECSRGDQTQTSNWQTDPIVRNVRYHAQTFPSLAIPSDIRSASYKRNKTLNKAHITMEKLLQILNIVIKCKLYHSGLV
jgi:hypothetical protein